MREEVNALNEQNNDSKNENELEQHTFKDVGEKFKSEKTFREKIP